MAIQVEKCYCFPPVFPKECGYLVMVSDDAGGSGTVVSSHEPHLRRLPEPVAGFLPWVSREFPFDAHHQHN